MIDLALIPEDAYKNLVALPYRIGLYVSFSDMTGGKESQEKELKALENVLTFYVEDTLKSEFSQSVMLGTLQNKIHWPYWRDDLDKVPDECRQVFDYLENKLDKKGLAAFTHNLFEIGLTVAMAYREEQPAPGLIEKLKAIFQPPKPEPFEIDMQSVSDAEKLALKQIADAFGIVGKVA